MRPLDWHRVLTASWTRPAPRCTSGCWSTPLARSQALGPAGAELRAWRAAEASATPSIGPRPAQLHRAPPGAPQLIDVGTVPAQLLDLARLDQAGAEVRLPMLACGRQSDRGHELGPGVSRRRSMRLAGRRSEGRGRGESEKFRTE